MAIASDLRTQNIQTNQFDQLKQRREKSHVEKRKKTNAHVWQHSNQKTHRRLSAGRVWVLWVGSPPLPRQSYTGCIPSDNARAFFPFKQCRQFNEDNNETARQYYSTVSFSKQTQKKQAAKSHTRFFLLHFPCWFVWHLFVLFGCVRCSHLNWFDGRYILVHIK